MKLVIGDEGAFGPLGKLAEIPRAYVALCQRHRLAGEGFLPCDLAVGTPREEVLEAAVQQERMGGAVRSLVRQQGVEIEEQDHGQRLLRGADAYLAHENAMT